MSIALLEDAAGALGDLLNEVAFVGGASVALWITDPGAPPVRPTEDVDVIVEVATRRRYYQFEKRLREIGFRNDPRLICRWHHGQSGLVLDAMPTDADLLGFSNRWQAESFPHALDRELPSGTRIRAVPPPFLLATKIEAFRGRGEDDYMASRDYGDIVALIDGREELLDEAITAPPGLREYLATELATFLNNEAAREGIYAQLLPDAASQERAHAVVLARMREIVAAVTGERR